MKCRICGHLEFQRARRKGFFQKMLLPLFGFYPWRCIACGKPRLLRCRHEDKAQSDRRNAPTQGLDPAA